MRTLGLLSAMILLSACGGSIPIVPTGSGSLAADGDGLRLVAANATEGSLSIVNLERNGVVEVAVGQAPTRLVVLGERAIATLRGERALVEVDLRTGDVARRVETGPEPYGIVASVDGTRLYVSISQAGVVEERDADTLEVLRTFVVGEDPRWLALHPDGHLLVAGHGRGEQLTTIDLVTDGVDVLPLPELFTDVNGALVQGEVQLAGRVTGDPIFTANGRRLVVPTFYVDHTSGELSQADRYDVPRPSQPYYKQAGVTGRLDRFNAVLVHYKVDRKGELERQVRGNQRIIDAAPGPDGAVVRQSYLTSVAEGPDGEGFLVTLEASDTVLYVDDEFKAGWIRKQRIGFPQASAVTTGRGPAGVAVLGRNAVYVHEALERTVADVDQRQLRRNLKKEVGDSDNPGVPTSHSQTGTRLRVAESVLDPDVELGRVLFYSAINPTMGAAGVSCSTCHYEGRTDGLTWELFNGPRNTPSLAGPVDEFGVVTWTNSIESVAAEAQFTVQHRMGADSLREVSASRIEAFLADTPLPDLPEIDGDAVARGRAVFERADVGCAECHSGPYLTDGEAYDLYGLKGVRTRSLVGVAASAPYLHDGRAGTLREVLDSAAQGQMGSTGQLSEPELSDLEAYLRSL